MTLYDHVIWNGYQFPGQPVWAAVKATETRAYPADAPPTTADAKN